MPSGGGIVKQWSTNVTGDTAGTDLYLVVPSPTSGGQATVVGVDHETVPATPPVSGVATFTLASPIFAPPGGHLALYSPSSSPTCYWSGGTTPAGDEVSIVANPGPAPLSGPPTTNQQVQTFSASPGLLNLSAVIAPAIADLSVTASSAPAKPTVGSLGVLEARVFNHGPEPTAVSFSDTVPAGLSVAAAAAGGGTCSVAGQAVSCTISQLAPGASEPVSVIVTLSQTGTYTNAVSVAAQTGVNDPNLANNSSTARLKVAKAGANHCVVPKLTGTPGRVAKRVLKLLGCKVTVRHHKGTGVARGAVLRTKPGAGTYAEPQDHADRAQVASGRT